MVTLISRPLVVVTGASGVVGRRVATALEHTARLRLVDRRPSVSQPLDGESVVLNLGADGAWAEALRDADTVIHLAGNASPAQKSRDVISGVSDLAAGLADALATSSVSHVILGSSIHTLGRYDVARRWPVAASAPAWPCCAYGAAKIFAENLLTLACANHGAILTSLRLGLTGWAPTDEQYRSNWTSDRDLMAVVRAAAERRPEGAFLVASNGARGRWDIETTEAALHITFHDSPPRSEPARRRDDDPRCLMRQSAHP